MESQPGVWFYLLMWFFWLGITALTALAVRAYRIELREGMKVSTYRLLALGLIQLTGTVVLVLMTMLPATPTDIVDEKRERQVDNLPDQKQQQARQVNSQLEQIPSELKQLDDQQRALDERRKQILQSKSNEQKVLDNLGVKTGITTKVTGAVEQMNHQSRTELGIGCLAVLLLAGILILLVGGQMQKLLPHGLLMTGAGGASDAELRAILDELADLVNSEKDREALEKAKTIPEKKLRPGDTLDLLFLRAFSAVRVVAFPDKDGSQEERLQLLASAISDLEFVTAEAPRREEAFYTLGVAYGLHGQHQESLASFEAAEPNLEAKMKPMLEQNKGICCLRLAEESLGRGNTEQAEEYYARASSLSQESGLVVQSRFRIAMIGLRSALSSGNLNAASATLAKMATIRDLGEKQKQQNRVIDSALNAQLALRRDDPQSALKECETFLTAHLPADLPELSIDTADETFSPILEEDLPFPRAIYQSFLFIRAVALSRLKKVSRSRLTHAEIDELSYPLLRALQFVSRQRDLLGALGGLYCWFRREDSARARQWLEAAVFMGARGRMIRAILEHDRLIEQERGTALDWFRSASARFLRDPALAGEVRHALVEELGRFQEFAPMLIQLQDQPPLEDEEPTVQNLQDRAAYLADLVSQVVITGPPDRYARLAQLQNEYITCLKNLEQNAQSITALEKRIFSEMADSLALR